MIVLQVIAFAGGLAIVLMTIGSSLKTVILPRAVPTRIARLVFLWMRVIFDLRVGRSATYERRDHVYAMYGPLSLLILLLVWILFILAGYTLMFWGLGRPPATAFALSGSSIVTLGFEAPRDLPTTLLVLTEAWVGLVELALLITYLPTIYGAFQRREALVSMLEVRAGAPPSGVTMLERFYRLHTLDHLSGEVWEAWEGWFVDVEETHTSLPALNFFRSPQPDRSWITAAGAVLDGAAIYTSSLDVVHDPHADLCIRAGYLCLRKIAGFFQIPYNAEPTAADPISISREEFDQVFEQLRADGLPMKPDPDEAWRGFLGWRVNYDDVLLALAGLVQAPYAPWSSDRGKVRRTSARALIGLRHSRR